jgi:hypothetical protein
VGDETVASPNHESAIFWMHLRASGLIAGAGLDATQPSNAYGGLMGIRDSALGITGHVTVFGNIEGPIAKILEGRLDDGAPDGGRVQAACTSCATPIVIDTATAGSTAYIDSERYDMAFRL